MSLPFLLEIGCEEIPDWMILPALQHLRQLFDEVLSGNHLSGEVTAVEATPRRLVLKAAGLKKRQADSEELAMGPPKSAGAGAAAGFAKKMGTTPNLLGVETTAKGEYLSFRKKIAGRDTAAILAEALPLLIPKIYFPKTMYWTGKGGVRFIRPIRWIVALLGEEVVPFEVAGVKSGNTTSGHRRLGKSSIPVSIATYEEELKKNYVLVSASERRKKIETEIAALGVRVKPDPKLLETLVYITEYPTVILGAFDPQYLALPSEVLVTVMRHHQKYFSVEDADGNLAPNFVAVMNTNADPDGLVRKGNERVLRARFNDARFFWEVDQHKTLSERVADLANVTFQAKLGSYLDKTKRVVNLTAELGGNQEARKAAELAKCDLTTEMVKEFTDLQGIIGGLYAKAQGEPEPVWRAIYEHYKPLSMEDSIPATADGRIVALADKLETLVGIWGIGLQPTGEKDPFALRRHALGVLRILVEKQLPIDLVELLRVTYAQFANVPNVADSTQAIYEFCIDRLRGQLRERGYSAGEVDAVLALNPTRFDDIVARLDAVREFATLSEAASLAAANKRISNILKKSEGANASGVQIALLVEAAEKALHAQLEQVAPRVQSQLAERQYTGALSALAALREPVDTFFNDVMVNAEDPALRANRLALLGALHQQMNCVADISRLAA